MLWRCFVRLDQWAVCDAVWPGEGSSVILWWVSVLAVYVWWISLVRRPQVWPRCLLLVVSLMVLLEWCDVVVGVGDAARRRQICSFRWQGVALTIVGISQAPVVSIEYVRLWRLQLCVGWLCSLS